MSEHFYYLVGKVLTNEATHSEREELEQLLHSDKELRSIYETLFAAKTEDLAKDELAAEQAFAAHAVRLQVEEELEQSKSEQLDVIHINSPKRHIHRGVYWAVAACILMVVSVSIFLLYRGKEAVAPSLNEVVTRKGSKSFVKLPDGTTVWLNADSKLSYEGELNGSTREVTLIGEGYFNVAKDKKRPFVIHAGSVGVKVLGTEFNLRSYPEEKTTETSLIHGSIEVTLNASPEQKIFLKPYDKLIVSNKGGKASSINTAVGKHMPAAEKEPPVFAMEKISFYKNSSISNEASWVENKLIFDSEPFETVALKIERWYNTELIVNTERLKSLRFTGEFERKSLKDVLEALQVSKPFHYVISDKSVTIW